MVRSYLEMLRYRTFLDRFDYLKLDATVGDTTFGHSRYLNQSFYRSSEWRRIRDAVIVRDEGRDLGVEGHELYDNIIVHHINPITRDMLEEGLDPLVFDMNNLISVSLNTHNAIHFSDESQLNIIAHVERRPGDTTPWRRK